MNDFTETSWLWLPVGFLAIIGLALLPVAPWIIGAVALVVICVGGLTAS